MPGEQIAGSLGIQIKPDFSGFGQALQQGLAPFSGASLSVPMAQSAAAMAQSSAKLGGFSAMPAMAPLPATPQMTPLPPLMIPQMASTSTGWTAHGGTNLASTPSATVGGETVRKSSNSLRAVAIQAMFSGWELNQASNAIDEGNFNIAMATTASDRLKAQTQQTQQAWSGMFAGSLAMAMSPFGAGPLPTLRNLRGIGAYAEATETLRLQGLSASFDPQIQSAIAGGYGTAQKRGTLEQKVAVQSDELREQIRNINATLDEQEAYTITTDGGFSAFSEGPLMPGGTTETRYRPKLGDQNERLALTNKRKSLQGELKKLQGDAAAEFDAISRELREASEDLFTSARSGFARSMGLTNKAAWIDYGGASRQSFRGLDPSLSFENTLNIAGGAMGVLRDQFAPMGKMIAGAFRSYQSAGLDARSMQFSTDALNAAAADNPVEAQRLAFQQQRFEAQRAILNAPPSIQNQMNPQIDALFNAQNTLLDKQVSREGAAIDRLQASQNVQLDFLRDRLPIGADVEGVRSAASERARKILESGPGNLSRANAEIDIGLRQINQISTDYLRSFRAENVGAFIRPSERDSVNVDKVNRAFDDASNQLRGEQLTNTVGNRDSELTAILAELRKGNDLHKAGNGLLDTIAND